MNDCATVRVREALPDYLHGTLHRRERLLVQAHLASCDDCSAELALLERCRLVMSAVPAVDTERIVAALPRPRTHSRGPGHQVADTIPIRTGWSVGHRRRAWRAAAVALLTVGALGVVTERGGHWAVVEGTRAALGPSRPVAPTSPPAAVRPGDSAMLATAASGSPLFLGGGISDLSDEALTALLGEVDVIEALPLVEPPTVGAFVVTELAGAE